MEQTPSLNDTLQDVRRSMRILVAYQQRINEIFNRFHVAMEKVSLSFEVWYPTSYAAPRGKHKVQFAPSNWAWDLFPGLMMTAGWQGGQKPVCLSRLSIYTDTAFNATKEHSHVEPDPLRFDPVDAPTSRTEIWIGLYTCNEGTPDLVAAWKDLQPRWKSAQQGDISWKSDKQTGLYRCFCVQVQDLVSAAEVDRLLIQPSLEWINNQHEVNK